MPQQQLDRAQIGARFEQVCREAVPQGVRPDALGETGAQRRFMTRSPHRFIGDRLLLFGRFLASREQIKPRLELGRSPILASRFARLLGPARSSVWRSFPLL